MNTREIKGLWLQYNREKFSGRLKNPKIRLFTDHKILGAYKFNLINNKVSSSSIWINKKCFMDPKLLKEVLLHEMTHQYVVEVLKKPRAGHNKDWKDACKISGAKPMAKLKYQFKNLNKNLEIKQFSVFSIYFGKKLLPGIVVRKMGSRYLFLTIVKNEMKLFAVPKYALFEENIKVKIEKRLRKFLSSLTTGR